MEGREQYLSWRSVLDYMVCVSVLFLINQDMLVDSETGERQWDVIMRTTVFTLISYALPVVFVPLFSKKRRTAHWAETAVHGSFITTVLLLIGLFTHAEGKIGNGILLIEAFKLAVPCTVILTVQTLPCVAVVRLLIFALSSYAVRVKRMR